MTAIALPATEARTTTPTRTRRGAGVRHFAHYLLHSWLMTLRDWSFLAFIMAMPVTIYLFFAGIYGDQLSQGGVEVAAIMMVTMATYGALGAAMSAGNQITNERSTGWFRCMARRERPAGNARRRCSGRISPHPLRLRMQPISRPR